MFADTFTEQLARTNTDQGALSRARDKVRETWQAYITTPLDAPDARANAYDVHVQAQIEFNMAAVNVGVRK